MVQTDFFILLASLRCSKTATGNPGHINEFRQFMKMMESPFFAAKAASSRLVEFLYESYYPLKRAYDRNAEPSPEEEASYQKKLAKAVSKQAAWDYIFPGEPYKEARITALLGTTKAHLETFIGYQAVLGNLESRRSLLHNGHSNLSEADQQALNMDQSILRYHLNRGEVDLFQKRMRKTWRLLEARDNRDGAWHEYAYRLEALQNDYLNRHYGKADRYNEMGEHFDHYYLLGKLSMYCAQLNRAHILGTHYAFPLMEVIVEFSQAYDAMPLIGIYRRILSMLQGGFSKANYNELWGKVKDHKDHISKVQLKQLAMYCRNGLQFEKLKGGEDINHLNEKAFEVTRFLEEEGILGITGKVSDAQFVFAVKTALAAGAVIWATEFTARVAHEVVGEQAEGAITFAECYISLVQGNHLPALKALDQIQFSSRYFVMQQRCLRLKLLFHLLDRDDPEYADSKTILNACDAFTKMILAETTFSEARKARFRNFVGLVKRLVRMKQGLLSKPEEVAALAERIHREPVEDKEWVREVFQSQGPQRSNG